MSLRHQAEEHVDQTEDDATEKIWKTQEANSWCGRLANKEGNRRAEKIDRIPGPWGDQAEKRAGHSGRYVRTALRQRMNDDTNPYLML